MVSPKNIFDFPGMHHGGGDACFLKSRSQKEISLNIAEIRYLRVYYTKHLVNPWLSSNP